MKKSIAIGIIFLFIVSAVTPVSLGYIVKISDTKEQPSIPLNRGKTLYVGGDGPGNYTNVQDAIDNASDGDTIFVYNKIYYENVWVDKSINLIGEDKNTTIIDGQDDEHYTVIIISPYVTLTGFTIQYCTNVDGIGILINAPHGDSHNNTIYGNIIRNTNYIGIGLYDSSNNNIYRNNITNHDWGIFVEGFYDFSSHNSIYQNNIMKNRKGIYFSMGFNGGTSDNRVYQNNFFLNSINAIDDGSANQWDNGSVGNFWDDYKGKDEDGNGIGDEPYWISKRRNIKDNYPLMKPYGNITSYYKNGQSSSQQSSSTPDSQESELQKEELDSLLSQYGLDTGDTMDEFEQLLYNLASKRKWMNPSLTAELINDIHELSDILKQIGVTDDMTIAEALPIIENNKEQLEEEGINLFCSIDMYAFGGACWPIYRFYKAIYGWWGIGHIPDHVTIKGLMGIQHCEDWGCKKSYEGRFIGLIGFNPPVMYYFLESASQETWIRGDFVLFSRSNLPFVNSTSGSQQTPCPCNQ